MNEAERPAENIDLVLKAAGWGIVERSFARLGQVAPAD